MIREGWLSFSRSLVVQLAVVVFGLSAVLSAGGSLVMNQVARAERRAQGSDTLWVSHLVLLIDELRTHGVTGPKEAERLLRRLTLTQDRVQASLFDDQGRRIAASAGYDLPPSALPSTPWVLEGWPAELTPATLDTAAKALMDHAVVWRTPRGDSQRVALVRVVLSSRLAGPRTRLDSAQTDLPMAPRPGGNGDVNGDVLPSVTIALTDSQVPGAGARRQAWLLLEGGLGLVALLSALGSLWLVHRVVAMPRELELAIRRVGQRPMAERLSIERTPTELRSTATSMNHMLDRLSEGFKRLEGLEGDVANDLRAPIHRLRAEARETLQRRHTLATYEALLKSTTLICDRLVRRIDDAIFLAFSVNPRAPADLSWVRLAPVLEYLVSSFGALAQARGIRLRTDSLDATTFAARIWANEDLLRRALTLLVQETVRRSALGGVVQVRVRNGLRGACVIDVTRSGPPVAPDHLAHVFDRVPCAERGSDESATGLELPIVKAVVEMHGGTVRALTGPTVAVAVRLIFPGPPPQKRK